MKKILAVITTVIIFFVLCFTVNGEEDYSRVIHDISPFALKTAESGMLNVFSETNEGWDSDMDGVNVTLSEKIPTFPYEPLTGGGCLIVRANNALSGERIYIEKTYSEPLDLLSYDVIMLSVNCTRVENSKYRIRAELYSDADILVFSDEIKSSGWNGVFIDVSEWEDRQRINKIRISVSYESPSVPSSDFEYYIDSITLSDNADAYFFASLGAQYYDITGGKSSYSGGINTVNGVGDELRLDSKNFAYKNMGDANSLRVDFYTEGLCQNVRLLVKRGENEYREESFKAVNISKSFGTVYLSLGGDNIQEISLIFEGVKLETVQLYGISPYSAYIEGEHDGVGIDTCVLNAGTEEIIIRGSVDRDNLTGEGGELYLFANEFCDSITRETLLSAEPIAKANVTSDDFIFRIDYGEKSDARAFLHKKYSVALRVDGEYAAISDSKCVTNPESFVKEEISVPAKRSGKGVSGTSISFMQEVGASDTAVWVDIGKFFESESSGGGKFECGGNLFYYNTKYVNTLNTMIENYAEKDIDVTVIFVVSDTGNEALNRVLIHKDAELDSDYCAYNTSDRQGLMYLRAITEFFASKYCVKNDITRFVFGDSVGNSKKNYNMGSKTLAEFVSSYANGLRTVYNAAKSYSPYVEVYTYIDDNWNRGLPFDLFTRYDNKAFLDSLNSCISSMGDIAWGLAHNPYPINIQDYFSYEDTELKNEYFSDRAGFKNIEVVVNYLKTAELGYNNFVRDYIIIEKSNFSAMSEENVTADYIYSCYRALNTAVSAYITDRSCNYNDAMKYVDTNLSMTASGFVSEILGVATWESVIDGFLNKNIVRRNISSGKIMLTRPDVKGKIEFSRFSEGAAGWKRYGFTERLTAGYNFSGKSDLLSVSLGNIPEGEARGVVKKFATPYDMSRSPILHFELNIASLPTNVNYAEITVVLTSGNDIYELTGRVKEAVWTEIYCDFSAFSGIGRVDSMQILFNADENYYDSPQAIISSVEALSQEYSDEELLEFNAPPSNGNEAIMQIRRYLYPILTVVISVALVLLLWRRTAKIKR